MKLIFQYRNAIVLLILVCLLVINSNIVLSGLDSNLFGIVFSIILFLIGGRKTSFNMNYPLLGIIFLLEFISFRLHTKSLHFLALALFACFVYYTITGKFSFIAFICIFLFSSIFNTFFEYLTVEIKQTLCYGVYLVLKNSIPITKIEGVNFYINNAKITIDTACMGLSMFKTGLLIGAFLLTLEERKQHTYFNVKQIFLFCFMVILLNIISNYFRIVILILFDCTDENALHYSIGMLCFIFYQIIPMLFLVRFFKPKQQEIPNQTSNKFIFFPVIIAFSIILATSLEIKKELKHDLLENLNTVYNIKSGIWINSEVFKIATPEKLIYIKIPSHNPLICWTGNGYKIIESKVIKKNNEEICFVRMEKNKIQYYSYWWYECDHKKYTSLVEILLIKLFYNKSVRLINETSNRELI
ncbi:exosortase N [Flavobacterium aquidurense]|uniref:Transmembrane exosortase (Exosortase EpsH) n=1 Tax=Flavobacterium aquidurense TaxID=362413 RepID=A0A0Q0S997_9FLAO|nr:exosortase N [Flavobacterium aquidurense]KQB40281.1 Transmembrane exosortase (Exosortase EpsH) [Flavobacterium aquidurense]